MTVTITGVTACGGSRSSILRRCRRSVLLLYDNNNATNKLSSYCWYQHRCFSATSSYSTKKISTKKISSPSSKDTGSLYLGRAGLPMILFCGLGVWVVANGLEGKNKERDAFQGRLSKSERQAKLDEEHDDMVEKLNKIVAQDFDNTKRIERPDEVLARRRKERADRNVWYRRYWRKMIGKE